MYAIVEIAGQQFKVRKDEEIVVHRLDKEPGKKIEFNEVLLVDDGGQVRVGKPFVEGTRIAARVLEHVRGDKVIVFHKKRRKGYQKSTGHRQDFTKIQIENIALKSVSKPKKAKEEEPKSES
ncbi:MAG: 50S ribosomal protein L21 [Bacteroidetes bacterium]|nr:MAG: 50S ribosomal protein L21 [Bacteroidota bacterium]